MSTSPKTIAFFGASTGVGLAALKHSLNAGHTCTALLRNPSKLDTVFPPSSRPVNLIIRQGNAHNESDVAACLTHPSDGTRFVDAIMFSIGGTPAPPFYTTIDDEDVCKKGMSALLSSIKSSRERSVTGDPLIIAISTTSHSRFGRDVAFAMLPIYWLFVKVPAADKQIMEDRLATSREKNWMIVRPSHLTDGASEKKIRIGVEDLERGVESREIGYAISREDVGKWCFENGLKEAEVPKSYLRKAVSVTN